MHLLMVVLFVLITVFLWSGNKIDESFDNYREYGYWFMVLYVIRICSTLPRLPLTTANFLGLMLYDLFPYKSTRKQIKQCHQMHVFRVVTRGLYPDLIVSNLERNTNAIKRAGMKNFMFEIVTNTEIGLRQYKNVREIVVPKTYTTKHGSLFKARSLQYCLEPYVNTHNNNDWIIHLDEETLMTEDSVIGIMDFTSKGQYNFGQGAITYADDEVINWITTFGDLYRVGANYGQLRFCFNYFQSPFFNWKGSYIVAKLAAERDVTFDFGPKGSVTEDCTFGMMAACKKHSFGFIEGEMWEQSPFTIMDFIRQRKRWVQGVIYGLMLKEIPVRYKLGIYMMMFGWIVGTIAATLDIILSRWFPLYFPPYLSSLMVFVCSVDIYINIVGAINSFKITKYGYIMTAILYSLSILTMPVSVYLEVFGVIAGLMELSTVEFYIVAKDVNKSSGKIDGILVTSEEEPYDSSISKLQ